jgi:hypothetical protein
MGQQVMQVYGLPAEPLDAADVFHDRVAPMLLETLSQLERDGDLVILFEPAGPEHTAWRMASVQDFARAAAPNWRCNAVVGTGDAQIAQALTYLAAAPGVTGQILVLDGAGSPEALG